jgi:hypothetical protein
MVRCCESDGVCLLQPHHKLHYGLFSRISGSEEAMHILWGQSSSSMCSPHGQAQRPFAHSCMNETSWKQTIQSQLSLHITVPLDTAVTPTFWRPWAGATKRPLSTLKSQKLCEIIDIYLFVCFYLFCRNGDGTQELAHAWEVLYDWATPLIFLTIA